MKTKKERELNERISEVEITERIREEINESINEEEII